MGALLNYESWTCNGRNLEVVSNFNYLPLFLTILEILH